MTHTLPSSAERALGDRVADRYQLNALLGRGGMAAAYRARDTTTGDDVALKLLTLESDPALAARSLELFEREFHTLSQLAHPRIVGAYDYGLDGGHPYYVMELLDGGDLRELSPLPWQRVCTIAYEICSALSLLHSRRLVHRDLTPRNIRLTNDGKAKLIDFGLLSPMGPVGLIAGTPPFMPPELINNASLDGRSDLFSLGATLYFGLTGKLAYNASRFDRLRDAWRSSPIAPSKLVENVPAALDELLLSLLRIDTGARPKSAAEVMDRLRPLLSAAPDEQLAVAKAYLTAPRLVGRDAELLLMRKQLVAAARRHGGGFVLSGPSGVGKSRLLDAFVLEAKLMGATAVRASADDGARPFGALHALAAQLYAALPAACLAAARKDERTAHYLFGLSLDDIARQDARPLLLGTRSAQLDRAGMQAAFRNWLLELTKQRVLAIAVDDVDRIDEPSAALLASLTWEAPTHGLAYALSVQNDAADATALQVMRKHAQTMALSPLRPDETKLLLQSVFGDAPQLALLSHHLHETCAGLPRECMALAQFLTDQGVIQYAHGMWTLPRVIATDLLPRTMEETLQRQLEALSPHALRIVCLLALSMADRLSRAQLRTLPASTTAELDAALAELVTQRLVTGDASGYALPNASVARLVTQRLSEAQRSDLHQQLSALHATSETHPIVAVYHQLLGHDAQAGLDRLLLLTTDSSARAQLTASAVTQLRGDSLSKTIELALSQVEQQRRPKRDAQALWVTLAAASAQGGDTTFYYRYAPAWLAQLELDSGLVDYRALPSDLEPLPRIQRALAAAAERYRATPEEARVLPPSDAIKQLVTYVACTIAVAVRALDLPLMASLPALLEPFAVLSPLVAAMLGNARGTLCNGEGKREQARAIFIKVLAQLDQISGAELAYVEKVRASLSQTMAEIDASLGLRSSWVERLSHEILDPNQAIGAHYLRKVAALQQGDWQAAEQQRQAAELLLLQGNARPMFSTLGQELEAHALARDLTGLKQVRAGIAAMAQLYPGWLPVEHVADAHYHRLCGDHEAALHAARGAHDVGGVQSPWPLQARILECELLIEQGRADEALALGESTLALCEERGMRYMARSLLWSVALAEARLGKLTRAQERLASVLEEQLAIGVSGLLLGRTYELCARVSLLAADHDGFHIFAQHTAEQYRAGHGSVLGALYERLMEEARQAGVSNVQAAENMASDASLATHDSNARVSSALAGCNDRQERALRALALLCDGPTPTRGQLFLLTPEGLQLVASNIPGHASSALLDFARACIDGERELSHTVTATLDAEPLATVARVWHGDDGVDYHALLLSVVTEQGYLLVGVALLADRPLSSDLTPLAHALAHHLLTAGDAAATEPGIT